MQRNLSFPYLAYKGSGVVCRLWVETEVGTDPLSVIEAAVCLWHTQASTGEVTASKMQGSWSLEQHKLSLLIFSSTTASPLPLQ
jgi:hypothetical protein